MKVSGKRIYLYLSIALAVALCGAHVVGSNVLVLPCLAAFLALVGWCCTKNYTLPILLFFLPWSPILRTGPDSFSFFTFGQVLVCAISVLKKRFKFKRYHIICAVALMALTLISKLIDGSNLSFDYFAFIMLILLFPVVKEEWTQGKYDFYRIVTAFSLGIILAALSAMFFANSPSISRFIKVDSYLTIIRRCGFYGDANFYTAQITAAMAGCFALLLKEEKKGRVAFLGLLVVLMIYCGFLSGSKSFVLVTACILLLWLISFIRMRGKVALKLVLFTGLALLMIYIVTSAVFEGLLEVIILRFSSSDDLDSFTTGRIELWETYVTAIFKDIKIFFLGKGFTNIKINDRGSHSTPLQIFYQFGLVGMAVLLFWVVCFYRDTSHKELAVKKLTLNLTMVLVGVVLPWFAIDILFFDEFFLLQWYLFIAMQQPQLRGASPPRLRQLNI